jgi:hypothetical protein
MKANRETDELLCSFIDGELPLRQQTEVQRLAARDPEVAQRLRELQNCRNLVSALPRAEAPGLMLEQIKQSLERQTLLEERPVLTGTRAGTRHLKVRRFVAAAAMIALLGGLGAVVYQIVAPVAPSAMPGTMARTGGQSSMSAGTSVVAATAGFSGRLELRTAAFSQADAFIKRAIGDNGLSGQSETQTMDGGRVYRIESSREGLNRLVADLGGIWQNFDAAALTVNSDEFAETVEVAPVTLQQTAKIVSQDSRQASVAMARDVAVLNSFAEAMPGQNILSRPESNLGIPVLPRPVLTSDDPDTKQIATVPEGTVKASLTIVLLNTQ